MKLYNTLTKQKEEFVPVEPGKVKMYVCGPTVYNLMHIGNARPFVVFDVVRRYLEYKGFEVNYVQNFTDIDDKIIKRSIEEGITAEEVATKYIVEVELDAKNLGVNEATHNPKATEEVDGIIEMITDLMNKGAAYEVNGTVYFESKTFEGYGKLSKKNIDDLESGIRIAVSEDKRNPSDFVLWKPKKDGEPFWESPWGDGRPGWHIECSVMAKKYLGNQIDIHAGGTDLIFPHHENEIAQSETANGVEFAKYWMHNGFINVDNQKMSKSKGNFFTVREIAEEIPYDVIRFFLLNSHYRSPINFSRPLMESATTSLDRIKTGYVHMSNLLESKELQETELSDEETQTIKTFKDSFEATMDDDFNTSGAIATIFDMVKYANTYFSVESNGKFVRNFNELFTSLCDILGVVYAREEVLLDSDIEALIENRKQARIDKDFALADKIRNDLLEMGIVLEDTREGVKFKRV
jgi:cysteinyl-tRNA synthetase